MSLHDFTKRGPFLHSTVGSSGCLESCEDGRILRRVTGYDYSVYEGLDVRSRLTWGGGCVFMCERRRDEQEGINEESYLLRKCLLLGFQLCRV